MNKETPTPRSAEELLKTAVFQSLGAASMCWSETPKGEFESDRAAAIGNNLMRIVTEHTAALQAELDKLKSENIKLSYLSNQKDRTALSLYNRHYGILREQTDAREHLRKNLADAFIKVDQLEAENKRLRKCISMALESTNGSLDAMEFDNSADVIERSEVIDRLNMIKDELTTNQQEEKR